MKKKIITLFGITIFTILLSATCYGYGIPDEYAPSNEPFHDRVSFEFSGGESTITPANFILQLIAGALLYFAAPIAIAMLVFAGFGMITGGASSEKQEQSKKHLQWTLVGLLAIMLSYSIVRIAIFFTISAAQQSAPPGV